MVYILFSFFFSKRLSWSFLLQTYYYL